MRVILRCDQQQNNYISAIAVISQKQNQLYSADGIPLSLFHECAIITPLLSAECTVQKLFMKTAAVATIDLYFFFSWLLKSTLLDCIKTKCSNYINTESEKYDFCD